MRRFALVKIHIPRDDCYIMISNTIILTVWRICSRKPDAHQFYTLLIFVTMRYLLALAGILFIALTFNACRRDIQIDEDPDARLLFSQDTIVFDTVFTTVGSTSRIFQVYNTSSKAVNIESIDLAGGAASPFRVNVDGTPTTSTGDILLRGGDSMFVFVDVTLDPNNSTNPLMIEDSIIFYTNGNRQSVVLNAVGRDAYFHYREISGCGEVWATDKPHVVYNYVIVPACCTLTIPAGADVYLHHNAVIAADSCATLRVLGSATAPVKFQGDRLEPEYADEPGQWGYIWLSQLSKDNEIDWAIIKNGTIGVLCDSFGGSANPTVRITNTKIQNMTLAGIFGRCSSVQGDNLEIANCAQYCVAIAYGGSCQFRHCTFGNYWNISNRTTPAVVVNNWYEYDNTNIVRDLTGANFYNCIIWGDKDNELVLDSITTGGELFNCVFAHSLIKTDQPTTSFSHFQFNVFNQDPIFSNGYHLASNSPARDIGDSFHAAFVPLDLDQYDRTLAAPDAGCYEQH